MKESLFHRIVEAVRDINRVEIRHAGRVWKEGKMCPMKVGAYPCVGVLQKFETETDIFLICSEQAVDHSISVPVLQKEAPSHA